MSNRIDDYRAFRKTIDAGSLAILEAIPDDKLDFRPTPEMMSLGEHLGHLALVERHILGLIQSGLGLNPAVSEPVPTESKDGLLASVREGFRCTDSLLAGLAESDLDRMISVGEDRRESVKHMLGTMAEHQLHHRGQIIIYFRMMGMTPPQRWAD